LGRLLRVSRQLYACAVGTNPQGALLTSALPEAFPQYQSRSVGDDLAWAAVWLADATGEHSRYLDAVRGHLSFGGNALSYEGFGALPRFSNRPAVWEQGTTTGLHVACVMPGT
jgi:hypothetical protein